jgi:hypothetical protein
MVVRVRRAAGRAGIHLIIIIRRILQVKTRGAWEGYGSTITCKANRKRNQTIVFRSRKIPHRANGIQLIPNVRRAHRIKQASPIQPGAAGALTLQIIVMTRSAAQALLRWSLPLLWERNDAESNPRSLIRRAREATRRRIRPRASVPATPARAASPLCRTHHAG